MAAKNFTVSLSDEQQKGLQFAVALRNEELEKENEQIVSRNENLKEGEEAEPVKELFTDVTYLQMVAGVWTNSYLDQAKKASEEEVKEITVLVAAATPEKRAEVEALLKA